ncbi:hypothetical protein BDW68DRAFT_150382 [Aspergillus falconensis]
MMVQISNIIGNNIYRENNKPHYCVGNRVLIALAAWSLALFINARYYYVWRNKKRAEIWDRMSSTEREQYLAANGDKGNKQYNFTLKDVLLQTS